MGFGITRAIAGSENHCLASAAGLTRASIEKSNSFEADGLPGQARQ
jgi:hypothetical protein